MTFSDHLGVLKGSKVDTLEESLSITTGRCDLVIVTHAKNLFLVVHPEVLDND